MTSEPHFLEPWRPVRDATERSRLEQQLASELVEGHPLWGEPLAIIGRNDANDDVIVGCGTGFAIVHLSFGPGSAIFPAARCYADVGKLNDALWKRAVIQGFVDEVDHNDPRLWDDSVA